MLATFFLLLLLPASAHRTGATSSHACKATVVGPNLDVPGHDLSHSAEPATADACGAACCADPKCAGALFEAKSCTAGKPCCFLKTSVAGQRPMARAMQGAVLLAIPGRTQDDEHLNFLSATLGSHMVLQQAPKQAVVWGHTAPGATVTTTVSGNPYGKGLSETLTTTAEVDGTWRQMLPPVPASKTPYSFTFASSNSTSERAQLDDVLFGEVFICGGQSNMEFALPAVANATFEVQEANAFPTIRIFSVGHRTQSNTPLRDLQTVWEPWQVASNATVAKDFSPGHTLFSTFSAVCWLFGQELSRELSPTGDVPVGLISNNWGGTKLEVWTPASAYGACNRTGQPDGPMYNAMVSAEGEVTLRSSMGMR